MTGVDLASLAPVLQAIRIDSPTRLSFAGHPLPLRDLAPAPASSLPKHLQRGVEALQLELYAQAYVLPFRGCRRTMPPPATPDRTFVAALSAANRTRQRWQSGWIVQGVDGAGGVMASRGLNVRSFRAGEFCPPGAATGTPIYAFLSNGSADLAPGFYAVFGDSVADVEGGFASSVRLYFNVDAGGAAPLVAHLTHRLNRFQVPFSFKVLSQPRDFSYRTDAAVLYLQRRHFHVAADLAARLPARLGEQLGPQTPLFAKALSPGIAVAEDPGDGESFGLCRCRLLSEAVWGAWTDGESSVEARLRSIERRFAAAGLRLDAPHLNAGSADDYQLPDAHGGP